MRPFLCILKSTDFFRFGRTSSYQNGPYFNSRSESSIQRNLLSPSLGTLNSPQHCDKMELPINVHSFTFCSKLHCHNINHFLFSYLSNLVYTKIALRKAHVPNIHALNSDTHALRIQYEYTQNQCVGVAIEGMHIWYIGLISLYHDIYIR